MNLKPTLLLVSLLSLVAGKGSSDTPSLNLYEFARSDRYNSSTYDLRTTFTFYPDGLIHTLSVTSYTIATRREEVERSLEVTRDGDVISLIYSKTDTKVSAVTYRLGSEIVSIHYSSIKPLADATLQRKQGTDDNKTSFEYLFGKLRYEFKLGPEENSVTTVLKMGPTTYTITLDPAKELPLIACKGVDQSRYEVGKIISGGYYILYKDPDGPLLASYKVEGILRSATPLIAVLNFLIYGNLIDGPAVFPFIGGMPR